MLACRSVLTFTNVNIAIKWYREIVEPETSGVTNWCLPILWEACVFQAIQQLQSKTTQQQLAVPSAPITHSAPMDIFQHLVLELDTEGRYLFLNAVANQLRYPNNHTHYFSCVLLYLFAEANHVRNFQCFHYRFYLIHRSGLSLEVSRLLSLGVLACVGNLTIQQLLMVQ